MNIVLVFGIFTALSGLAYLISFSLSLWLLNFFIKQRNPRYVVTGILNALLTPIGIKVSIPGIHPLLQYVVLGLPVLGLLYWLEVRREARK